MEKTNCLYCTVQKYKDVLLDIFLKNPGTTPNSEYRVPLRSSQIASGRKIPMATSGIRETIDAIKIRRV